jgi:hypothetical protein
MKKTIVPFPWLILTGLMAGNLMSQQPALIKEINAESVTAANTRTREAVAIASKEISFRGNTLNYRFPAHSFTQMLIKLKEAQ